MLARGGSRVVRIQAKPVIARWVLHGKRVSKNAVSLALRAGLCHTPYEYWANMALVIQPVIGSSRFPVLVTNTS